MRIIILTIFCLFLLSCKKEDWSEEKMLLITYPDGPEAFVKGTICAIVWEPVSDSPVNIDLYQDGEFSASIIRETKAKGTYTWTIPEGLEDGSDYQIRISEMNDSKIYGLSKKHFQLLSPGQVSTFTDARDGFVYSTVRIGEQVWMAENFKYLPVEGSFYYDNNEAYFKDHGRLYTLEAAIKHCPEGWHLPSDEDWKELEVFLGMPPEELDLFASRGHSPGELLRPVRGIGFNSIFSGYYNYCFDGYGHISYESHYWTTSGDGDGNAIIRIIDGHGGIIRLGTICHLGCSVRYIKN